MSNEEVLNQELKHLRTIIGDQNKLIQEQGIRITQMRMMLLQKPLISEFEEKEKPQVVASGWTIENAEKIRIAMESLY